MAVVSDARLPWTLHHDGQPVPQDRPRVARTGHVYYGPRSTAHKASLARQMKAAWTGAPLAGPLRVSVAFAGMRANADLDNGLKMVLDALQDAGVIAGDDISVVTEVTGRVVQGEPHTLVFIESREEV
jgi:Holliday junction resolvase RusA-like endonuclease